MINEVNEIDMTYVFSGPYGCLSNEPGYEKSIITPISIWMDHFKGKEFVHTEWIENFFQVISESTDSREKLVKFLSILINVANYLDIPLLLTCAVKKIFSLTSQPPIHTCLFYLKDVGV
jgi:hypothetical protein